MRHRHLLRGPGAVLMIMAMMIMSACGTDTPAAPGAGAGSSSGLHGEITVLAAASLTEAFETVGEDFEKSHPGTKINFSFGSSATLATQITEHAPADVFAAANESTMQRITDAGLNDEPTIFVTNTLEIAVPPGNPAKITGLKDFADESKKIALCAPQVPCGSAAEKVFQQAGITAKPDTLEQDVKATLQKVRLNEVDAALVYRTDVTSAGHDVEGIDFPEASSVVNSYPICTLSESKQQDLAGAFVDYVMSAPGQEVLSDLGFGQP